ncbi:MAG: hypothetical protein ABWK04_04385 [Hydrogenobacter sp.]|uniref:hypothetical protein n=1 Tax=Hydrogenobacter thermophilus TaxID=940 RepID=UPI0030F63C60
MDRVPSIEDSLVSIVENFFKDIDKKEPFYMELSQYRFSLKSKLTQILSQFAGDYETGSKSFNSAVEATWKALEDAINKLNLENEKELERATKVLEQTNEVLKEFLYEDRIKDKGSLSAVSGRIGDTLERLSYEMRRRSGLIKRIKKLLGMG